MFTSFVSMKNTETLITKHKLSLYILILIFIYHREARSLGLLMNVFILASLRSCIKVICCCIKLCYMYP